MALTSVSRPNTLAESFSFYLPSSDTTAIEACSELADAVTIKGPKGPETIRTLRNCGWDRPALLTAPGYDTRVLRFSRSRAV